MSMELFLSIRFFLQVTTWLQLQIPQIEDGDNFGVAVQVVHR